MLNSASGHGHLPHHVLLLDFSEDLVLDREEEILDYDLHRNPQLLKVLHLRRFLGAIDLELVLCC